MSDFTTLKRYDFDRGTEVCRTCRFIDDYAFCADPGGKEPRGWDGMAACFLYDESQPETRENRDIILPNLKACPKYVRCSESQADYLEVYDPETGQLVPNPNDISGIPHTTNN